MKKLMLVIFLTALNTQANIVCQAQTTMGEAFVDIADAQITVSGAGLALPAHFPDLNTHYDGHMTTLITAPGLAVSYENIYGCIRNATIITNFRDLNTTEYIQAVTVKHCKGGSTPDDIYFRNR